MSHQYKPGLGLPPAGPSSPPVDVRPQERERVAQLIASHKSRPALDLANGIHKRCRSAASEALLLDTYGARVASLLDRDLNREAQALIDVVRERFPSAGERLREWNAVITARGGQLDALLQPLTDPLLPAENQARIGAQVRRHVFDLQALAESPRLAPEHPLRVAAAALHKAFVAVTSGPVDDAALALSVVSRSSPLAPWKMLIRAIAAWYRRDDALCEKCLAAVEPDSAAARLTPPLRVMLHKPHSLSPAASALVGQTGGDIDRLRAALKRLDSALNTGNHAIIVQEIRNALAACRSAEPALLERFKQHISVRAMMAETKPDRVSTAMDGPSLKNAYFWRLFARAHEEDKRGPIAIAESCAGWEQFRRHAVHEGWFPGNGPEVATLYLRISDQLRHLGQEDLEAVRAGFKRRFDGYAAYYQGQPPEIRAIMPDRNEVSLYFLSPYEVLRRACEADPCAENFQRWMRHAEGISPASCDQVAETWLAALPGDIAPLLHLMQSAEKRNALQKAFKFMEQAEAIDGLNPEVRRARFRLLISMAVRHLREKKPKLAEKELRQMEALPQAQPGDRSAFVAALRFSWHNLRDERKEAVSLYDEVVRLMGDAATAHLLLLHTHRWCGGSLGVFGKAPLPTVPLFESLGRVCALGQDVGMDTPLYPPMIDPMMRELSAPHVSANPRILMALGEAALSAVHLPFAYTIAGVGLTQGPETQARFLFLRARSLPPFEDDRRADCLAAAAELARRNHDFDLLRRIGEFRERSLAWLDVPQHALAAMGTPEIGRIVELELDGRMFPEEIRAFADHEEVCGCPACVAEREELPPELVEMMEELGPEVVLEALADLAGIGGKKKRRRRHSKLDDLDIPF